MKIPLSQPSITQLEIDSVTLAITEKWISGTGPDVREFEQLLTERIGRHALACSNGTVALEATLRMLGVGYRDQVIVPALSFAAPAAAVINVGAIPVFVDIDPVSWTIDPEQTIRARSAKVKAAIAVDLLGHPADYENLKPLELFNIFLIEDAAEAHGAKYQGRYTGLFGVAATFSFHANKGITAGEGGAILTHHEKLYDKLKLYLNHGMTPEKPYYHEMAGTNGRLGNLQAALACAQMERWDELISKRNEVAYWYDQLLPEEIGRRPVAPWAQPSTWLYTVTHSERDQLVTFLREHEIDSRAIWPMLPNLPLYATGERYPVANRVSKEAFWLPTSAEMTYEDVELVVKTIKEGLTKI